MSPTLLATNTNTPKRFPQGAFVGDSDGGRSDLSQRKPSASAHPVHVKRSGKARKRCTMQNLSTIAQRNLCDPIQQTKALPYIPSFLRCRMRQLTLSITRVHRDMFDQYQVANEVERSFV